MRKAIPAIQTRYGGRLYRSRVESRWAVLFDCLGIRFSYEPEGFALGSGAYLPDFWLQDLKMFLEIKGQEPTAEECAKCAELAERLECDALLAVGPPSMTFQIHWFDRGGQREHVYAMAQDRFAECGFWLVCDDHANWIGPARGAYLPGGPMFSGALEEATETALSARFGTEWRRRSHEPVPHQPHRLASLWLADDQEHTA